MKTVMVTLLAAEGLVGNVSSNDTNFASNYEEIKYDKAFWDRVGLHRKTRIRRKPSPSYENRLY